MTNSAATQVHNQEFELGKPNNYPIYDLLECVKALVLCNYGLHDLQQQQDFWVTGQTESFNLDMAPDAFDDQYEGCVQEMEKKAPQLLEEDFNMNKELKFAWEMAEDKWKEVKHKMTYLKGFSDYHGTAVVMYTGGIYKKFNKAVRDFKKDPSNFPYKAFHYYLTRALQLLNNNKCYTVYRGTNNKFHYSGTGFVRFGHFASSSLNKNIASSNFGSASGTLFTIITCLGVNITGFSYFPYEKEVLIPGYEAFKAHKSPGSEKTMDNISLTSPKRGKSNFNCFYSSEIQPATGLPTNFYNSDNL
ncbi:T-cell ecto-ADP-ribosyltransferase 1-like [Cricetulus griseus]|uniref:T-cell ecto-ADP-ribosyltransferase 1-like n=1 Tax=Cricetulus griseus TaxID=10029 RepID=UPI0004542DFF|nr:T-cell ecto-ADP-ribosyltransferase 1-like [Cricetulus griseus]